ncbi:MAG TPA: hypothetical protein PKV13_06525 [Propionicimonas sp.]|nr:hypothetical protein [Propionicimonas sp.]HRA06261.1 hypothetical protein [Propionicimonas sp.]
MATWEDGPEYAPLARPQAFVTPAAEPLAQPSPPVPPPAFPEAEPHFEAAPGDAPALAALVPSFGPGRNPNLPFEVVTAALTAPGPGSAAAGRPERSPLEPFGPPGPSLKGYLPVQPTVTPNAPVNPAPFPSPGTPQWFTPPPQAQGPAAPPAVSIGQIFTAITPAVLITLAIGALFSWLSLFMLALSFTLSARIAYRRESVRRAYSVAFIVLAAFGAVSLLSDGWNADSLFDSIAGAAQLACWLLPLAVFLIVGSALRAGERPDRTG